MKKIVLLSAISIFSVFNSQAQAPIVINVHGQLPFFFGGKGKVLSDVMVGASYERLFTENISTTAGFGIIGRLAPTKYSGTTIAEKNDYGAYNQALPSTLPVNYSYQQKHIGLQFFLDARYYFNEYTNGGLYAGAGFGFENLSFVSSVDKYDDYNYSFSQKDKDAPYSNTAGTTSTNYSTGSLNIREILGYSFKLSDTKFFFVECITNFRVSKKESAPVEQIYKHSFMFAPAAGIKFVIPR